MLRIREIMELLPHRYPFLLVDRIVEWDPGKRIVGIKNVTINEPFFQGHFPGHPIMPGVLIVEALAQTGGILALKAMGGGKRIAYFTGIDNCKFRRPVVPGDQVRLDITVIAAQVGISGSARIGDRVMIGGQSGLAGHLEVGDGVMLGAKTGVAVSLSAKENRAWSGVPAMPHRTWLKMATLLPRLPELFRRVARLEGGKPAEGEE